MRETRPGISASIVFDAFTVTTGRPLEYLQKRICLSTMVDRGRFLDFGKSIRLVDARIHVATSSEANEPLHVNFMPGNWDVICQGGKDSYDHSKFRTIVIAVSESFIH